MFRWLLNRFARKTTTIQATLELASEQELFRELAVRNRATVLIRYRAENTGSASSEFMLYGCGNRMELYGLCTNAAIQIRTGEGK